MYETTAADPHTIRLTFKLKDMIDGRLLREAVDKTMARYPYFQVRLIADGKDDLFFEYNPAPVPVLNTDERTILGSEQTSGHLLSVSYWHNRLHIDVYHGLTDGGGIGPFLKTLLYYYCSFYYGADFSREGIRLSGESVPQAEWDDPARLPLGTRHHGLIHKWDRPALQLLDAGIAHPVPDSVVYNMRIPEKDFMRFNFSNDVKSRRHRGAAAGARHRRPSPEHEGASCNRDVRQSAPGPRRAPGPSESGGGCTPCI